MSEEKYNSDSESEVEPEVKPEVESEVEPDINTNTNVTKDVDALMSSMQSRTNNQALNNNDPRNNDDNDEEKPYSTLIRKSLSKDEHIGNYLLEYLSKSPMERRSLEYELRFGTHNKGSVSAFPITKTEYDNIISRLKTVGFKFNDGNHTLKIIASNPKVKVRVELNGMFTIQTYCKNEDLSTIIESGKDVSFVYKKRMQEFPPQDYQDFGFRVSLQQDYSLGKNHKDSQEWINKWSKHRKRFRFMNRIIGHHPDFPNIRVDLSIVKSSLRNPTYTIRESNLLEDTTVPRYEVEIEFTDQETYTPSNDDFDRHYRSIKRVISEIMKGIQESQYPISYSEMMKVSQEYMDVVHGKKKRGGGLFGGSEQTETEASQTAPQQNQRLKRLYPKHFIGPSSISLDQKNLVSHNEESNIVSIQKDFVVTDKADGLRKLLFISQNGRIYFINTGMKFQFTGMTSTNIGLTGSILDGEHIMKNKFGETMNLYAVFDIYFYNAKDLRKLKFAYIEEDEETSTRLGIMDAFLKELSLKPVGKSGGPSPLRVQRKHFKLVTETTNIFKQAESILTQIKDGAYDYNTDGLILSPAFEGVALRNGEPVNQKTTWNSSFKWKPPEYNTVDFLALIKQDGGQDKVEYTNKKHGTNGEALAYKTLLLHVGHDQTKNEHGYLQPCKDVLEDNVSYIDRSSDEYTNQYKATPFEPTNPEDENAKICYVPMLNNQIFCEEDRSVILDKTIIECRYDHNQPDGWKWIPIRVRHDKTAEFRSGIKNYGNSFHTANSVWQSIHHPVTEDMITGKQSIGEENVSEDVYYNSTGLSQTRPLRDFHNLYVKRRLIHGVSKPEGTLIDLAVGKAGDLPKWNSARLKFVLGVDISKDNIHNRYDGACARYLNARRRYKNMFRGIFLQGNSSSNIRSGDAMQTEKGKEIVKSLFGYGPKNKQTQEKLVYQYHGVAQNGFDVVSCQFAVHYFFQNADILKGFLENISETCALNGYFIGTTYDGEKVFDFLQGKKKGDSITYYAKSDNGMDTHKIWEIRKQYDREEFHPDETSLGYPIDIYQETINQTFEEYLVNFSYFKEIMKDYGFELITREQARNLQLPNGSGMFSELYSKYIQETNNDSFHNKRAKNYGETHRLFDDKNQRNVSFLNRYFVFQKVRGQSNQEETENKTDIYTEINKTESERRQKSDVISIYKKRISHPNDYKLLRAALKNIGNTSQFTENSFHEYLTENGKTLAKDNNMTDYDIYIGYRQEKISENASKIQNDNVDSSTALTQNKLNMERAISRAKSTVKMLQKGDIPAPKTYLDYGCGDGSFTRAVRDLYKLDNTNVFCTDIVKYPSLDDLNFIEQVNGVSDLPTNTFDLITSYMVLHHIRDDILDITVKNIYSALKPGGIFIIREHNAPDDKVKRDVFQSVVDIVHDVYDYVIDTEMTWKDNDEYFSKYKSMREWTYLMTKTGFKTMPPKQQPSVNRKSDNPQNKYYRIYQKPLQEKIQKLKPKKEKTDKPKTKTTRKKYVAKKNVSNKDEKKQ